MQFPAVLRHSLALQRVWFNRQEQEQLKKLLAKASKMAEEKARSGGCPHRLSLALQIDPNN